LIEEQVVRVVPGRVTFEITDQEAGPTPFDRAGLMPRVGQRHEQQWSRSMATQVGREWKNNLLVEGLHALEDKNLPTKLYVPQKLGSERWQPP
jgi:hypothetical protein